MKHIGLVNFLKTTLALLLAIVATLTFGAFSGYPANPDYARARIQAIDDYHETKQVFTSEEIDGFYERLSRDVVNPPKIHPAIAILDWYPFMLGVSAIIFLLLFRPWGAYFIASCCCAVSLILVFVGTAPAMMLAGAGFAYAIIWCALARRKHHNVAA